MFIFSEDYGICCEIPMPSQDLDYNQIKLFSSKKLSRFH